MNLWRLERLRLTRTGRWVPLFLAFTAFGVIGPVTARFASAIVKRFSQHGATIILPTATPADGISSYIGNAQQFGILATAIIAAGALALDTRPSLSSFLRTRVRSLAQIVLPRFMANSVAAAGSFLAGAAIAWVTTGVLIGRLPVGAMVAGMAYGALYVFFAVSVVALAGSITRSQLATVLLALGGLIALPIMGLVKGLGPWLPSYLIGSLDSLLAGARATAYVRATVITIAAVPLLLAASAHMAARREL